MKRRSLFCLVIVLMCYRVSYGQSTFQNVTETSGISETPVLLSLGDAGVPVVSWLDYNNDGRLDLLVGSPTIGEEYRILLNRSSAFDDVTVGALQMLSVPIHGAALGDYDNDGYVDLYLTRGKSTNMLLKNRGDGAFADVSQSAGVLAERGIDRGSSSFVDYDNDGDLDLFVGDYQSTDFLYQNQNDGTFLDVTENLGIAGQGNTTHHMFGDYDNDGLMDLFVAQNDPIGSNLGALYHNEQDGRFADVTQSAGILGSAFNAEGVLFVDINNDNWLDLLITTGHHGSFGFSLIERNLLYRNNRDGTFSNVTQLMGVVGEKQSSGVTAGDYDNDGWTDIVVSNSITNHLFHNDGGQRFSQVAVQSGIEEEGGIGAVNFGDYGNDGFLDLFFANLKFIDNQAVETPGLDLLYQNLGNLNHWLQIELVGIQSNRSGIGARIQVSAGDLSMNREVSGGNGYGGESLVAEFGLGTQTQAAQVEVRWPSGLVDVFQNVLADQKIRVFEGRESYHVVEAVDWSSAFPDTVVAGEPFSGGVRIRPALFESGAKIMGAKLTGLGNDREILIDRLDDGIFSLDADTLIITGEPGKRMLVLIIEQETTLGAYQTALPFWVHVLRALPSDITVVQQQVDFGEVEVGRAGQSQITIRNDGQGALTISNIKSDASEFSLPATAFTILVGDSTNVVISFTPQASGMFEGVIEILSNDLDSEVVRIPFLGTGVIIPAHPGTDFNGNGTVDFPDFLAFAQAFNSTNVAFDFNDNGTVDFADFLIFTQSFGKSVN